MADEYTIDDGEIVGGAEVVGDLQTFSIMPAKALGPYDYVGASSLMTQSSYAWVKWSNYTGNQISAQNGAYTCEASVPVIFQLEVEKGHTYSGQVLFYLHIDYPLLDKDGYTYQYMRVGLSDFVQQSNYDGITVAYRDFANFGSYTKSGTCDVTLIITFDNYQPTFTGDLTINSMFDMSFMVKCMNGVANTNAPNIYPSLTARVASDWAGSLYDYPSNAIYDSEGSLIKNQTEQQQQIAQQQQQQSQQQHEEMTEKVDESTNIIDKGLDRLGNTILDGIKSFFIPSNEYFTALFDDLKVWFEERMGLLSAPLVFLLDILGMFTGSVPMGEITLPAIGFGDIWISQPMTFRLSDYPVIETLQGYCHIATNIMMTLWVIELFQKKEKEVLHS